jgi:hypothetical protein
MVGLADQEQTAVLPLQDHDGSPPRPYQVGVPERAHTDRVPWNPLAQKLDVRILCRRIHEVPRRKYEKKRSWALSYFGLGTPLRSEVIAS